MSSPAAPKKTSKLRILLILLTTITFFSTVVLMCLLAMDVFTIPYLTPLAHFLAIILAPFVPLLAPLMLGAFLKVCQHPTFPGKKVWVLVTGCWCLNQVQRVTKDVRSLWSFTGEEDALEICGLRECKGSWVEVGLLLIVVVGQWRGWRWDVGVVDNWVEGIVLQAVKAEEAKKLAAAGRDIERGVVQDEKREVVVEEVVGGDMEKTPLLVEVEEKDVEKA
ncbi:hypothetical protein N431DRAFT_427342 [Stipitochalara longipes BDJ]|nr:hypothetical protein N431DRAFT_427342 [Stipitochalara longipes BDJ]